MASTKVLHLISSDLHFNGNSICGLISNIFNSRPFYLFYDSSENLNSKLNLEI